ncbi:hypothetical protein [Streptomyces sp. AB3(2024)]|uniref:hypothetical protein n=1 Tax=Streptomyces sp. AB3(2024) TaxID=3317321 RepID=UPI0035A28565
MRGGAGGGDDHAVLLRSRLRVLDAADVIVPGRGPAFPADDTAPRQAAAVTVTVTLTFRGTVAPTPWRAPILEPLTRRRARRAGRDGVSGRR